MESMSLAPKTEDDTQWYYIDASNNYVGPVSMDGLKALLSHKYVSAETFVWAAHLSEWQALATLPGMPSDVTAAADGARGAAASSVSGGGRALPSLGIRKRQGSTDPHETASGLPLQRLQAAGAARNAAPSGSGVASTPLDLTGKARAAAPKVKNDLVKKPQLGAEPTDSWTSAHGMRLLTDSRMLRAVILEDGEVRDGAGVTLAYINDDGQVGNDEMQFVGEAQPNTCQVINATEQVVGEYDLGRGYIKDPQGSVVAELTKEGVVTGNRSQTVGRVEGFKYEHMMRLAAYIFLVDPAYCAGY